MSNFRSNPFLHDSQLSILQHSFFKVDDGYGDDLMKSMKLLSIKNERNQCFEK